MWKEIFIIFNTKDSNIFKQTPIPIPHNSYEKYVSSGFTRVQNMGLHFLTPVNCNSDRLIMESEKSVNCLLPKSESGVTYTFLELTLVWLGSTWSLKYDHTS